MGKVNHSRIRLPFVYRIHTPFDAFKRSDSLFYLLLTKAQLYADCHCSKAIVYIKFTRDLANNMVFNASIGHRVGAPLCTEYNTLWHKITLF